MLALRHAPASRPVSLPRIMSQPSQSDFRPDRSTLLAFATVAVLGGANAVAVKQTVQELAPFWGATLRFTLAGLLLLGFVVMTGRHLPSGRSLAGAALYGTVGFAASYGFAYTALRDVPAGTAAVLIALTPLFTFGLAIVHGQERFRSQGLAGAMIALAGIAIVFVDQLTSAVPPAALILLILGTVCIAESSVIAKAIPRSDPFSTNAVAMLTGAAILLALSVVAGETWLLPVRPGTQVAVAYLVVLGSVVMFALFLHALARWTASAMSYITLLMPLVTVSLAAVLTGERISPSFAAGGVIILVGVYVGSFQRPRTRPVTSLPECLPERDLEPVPPAPAAGPR
jgi:drug/metabolite transporter (DMT)-like permease